MALYTFIYITSQGIASILWTRENIQLSKLGTITILLGSALPQHCVFLVSVPGCLPAWSSFITKPIHSLHIYFILYAIYCILYAAISARDISVGEMISDHPP